MDGGGSTDSGRSDGGSPADAGFHSLWQQVPLRTTAQKSLGFSGGEGMQQPYAMSYAPSNPSYVYLVSDTSQTWKSTDEGASWRPRHVGFRSIGGYSIEVDPQDAQRVLVAGAAHARSASNFSGIFASGDGAMTWRLAQRATYYKPSPRGGHLFAFSGSLVLAATYAEGILRSTDRGLSWSPLRDSAGAAFFSGREILDIHADPSATNTFYVSVPGRGFYRLREQGGGFSTTLIGSGLPPGSAPNSLAIERANGSIDVTLYASVASNGVFKSTNGGISFMSINSGLESALRDGALATNIALSPIDRNRLYVNFNRTHSFYSSNGGTSWLIPDSMDQQTSAGWVAGSLIGPGSGKGNWYGGPVIAHPTKSGHALMHGYADSIKSTSDGGRNWKYSTTGYTGGLAQSFGWDTGRPARMVRFLIDYGPFLSTDGGDTFRPLPVPRVLGSISTPVGAMDPSPNSRALVTAIGGWNNQKLAVSVDDGASWSVKDGTDGAYTFLAYHPQKPSIIYAGGLKSTNSGTNWNPVAHPVRALFPQDGDLVYATVEQGPDKTRILRSSNAGTTWSNPFADLPVPPPGLAIAVDPVNAGRVYVAAPGSGIYVLTGQQLEFKNEAHGLQRDSFGGLNFRLIAVDPRHPEVVYAGTWVLWMGHSNGIFRSVDGGQRWANVSFNLGPEFTASSIAVNPLDGYVYIGSYHGTWRLPPPY